MRTQFVSLGLALAISTTTAHAAPQRPDLTITWDEGEYSKDMSVTHVEITVTGTKIHYESKYSGRDSGLPGNKPQAIDGEVKDPQQLAAALAALDKVPARAAGKPDPRTYRATGCVIRGKATRCATIYRPHQPGDQEDEFKAVYHVEATVLEGVKL
jgi:hypothetical protein